MSPVRVGSSQLAVGVTAIIPAAGSGSRVGGPTPKQFLSLAGQPVLARTLRLFQDEPLVDEIVVATGAAMIEQVWDLARSYGCGKVTQVVSGGATRQESVGCALSAISSRPRILVVHDAARPLLPPDLLHALLQEAAHQPALVMAVPVADTIKRAGAGRDPVVIETLPRAELWAAQTPQVFHASLLERAFRQADADGFVGTDCSSLVERLGVPVRVFPGSPENLKLTTPEDFTLALGILARRGEAT